MAKDPVCGMDVDQATTKWTSEYNGQIYYFCSKGCKADFDDNPSEYASSQAGEGSSSAAAQM